MDTQELRNRLGCVMAGEYLPGHLFPDNVAVALCTYFDNDPAKPPEDIDESGWTPWVVDQVNATLDAMANVAIAALTPNQAFVAPLAEAIAEAESMIRAEQISGNIVKEHWWRGKLTGLRAAQAMIKTPNVQGDRRCAALSRSVPWNDGLAGYPGRPAERKETTCK